jgi:hypothetical protein
MECGAEIGVCFAEGLRLHALLQAILQAILQPVPAAQLLLFQSAPSASWSRPAPPNLTAAMAVAEAPRALCNESGLALFARPDSCLDAATLFLGVRTRCRAISGALGLALL